MPTNYIKKLSKEGKGSVPELEKYWDRAEDLADKQNQGDNHAYRTAIFKNLVGATMKIEAKKRIQASDVLDQGSEVKTEMLTAEEVDAASNYLEKLVSEGKHGSREEIEQAWEEAKGVANSEGIQAYPYMVAVFQRKLGIRKGAGLQVEAAARLAKQ